MTIQSYLLPHFTSYINGRWISLDSVSKSKVINPATGECLAEIPEAGETQTKEAIEAASKALNIASSIEQRQKWLSEIHRLLIENKEELGRIITLEHGKPLKEAIVEVEYSARFFRFFAEQLSHLNSKMLPESIRNCQWTIHHRPAGVVGLITPWNFPLGMLAKKLAPALGADCSIVTKPANLTPLTAIAFWTLLERLKIPAGKLNLIIGKSGPIGDVLCSHPAVRVISFTGSTEVGKLLIQKTAPHIKRLALELGGNAPFIVFEDADLEAAANGLMSNKFRSGGQTCVCANRVYVHKKIADSFAKLVTQRVAKLRVGDGMDVDTDIGPLIDRAGFDKVAQHVQDALSHGAQRLIGNDPAKPDHAWGNFYPPTVLMNVNQEMLVCQEETFGPVVAISAFDSEEQTIEEGNRTQYGLAAYVFTRDPERAKRVVRKLSFGHVGVNTGTGPTPEAPFGGMKQSGFGREGGLEGLFEFCETQVVASP